MNERQAKLQALKNKQAKQTKQAKANEQSHKELLASIASLQDNISALEQSLSQNGTAYTKSQKDLAQNFTTLREILEAGLNVNNIKDIKQAKEIIVSNLKDIPKPVVNTTKTEIPKWLASEKGIATLNDSVIKVVEALIDLEANIKPKQNADEFVPMRRVVRRGNKLEFDDSYWGGSGGGGSSGSSNGLTDAQLRATPVDVTLTTGDIEIGAVELKNGTDDTRATVTAGNALKVDGSATTQPVSGTVTETNSAAIKTAVETIDNIVSGTGANISQVGGTNVDTNSGNKSAGTQRVVLATDQPQLTNALKVDGSAVTQPVSGTVTTTETVPTTIYNGKKTVTTAGTRVTLASSQAVKSVTIKALSTNTGIIYVGDTSVASTNGFQLSAGETISMDIANLNTVNLDSSVSGESVTYIGVN